MAAQSGECWLCKQEDPSSLPQTHISKASKQKTSVWWFMLVIPVLGGQTQAGPCSLLNGKPQESEIFHSVSSALSFHWSPTHDPSVHRHEGPMLC